MTIRKRVSFSPPSLQHVFFKIFEAGHSEFAPVSFLLPSLPPPFLSSFLPILSGFGFFQSYTHSLYGCN